MIPPKSSKELKELREKIKCVILTMHPDVSVRQLWIKEGLLLVIDLIDGMENK